MNNKTKRQEQIELAASSYYDRYPYFSAECNFRHGAQWADEHPNIKWHDLRKNPNDLPEENKEVLVSIRKGLLHKYVVDTYFEGEWREKSYHGGEYIGWSEIQEWKE